MQCLSKQRLLNIGHFVQPSKCWSTVSIDINHYVDDIMGAMASQITSLALVYSTVYSGRDQRKHQSFGSLGFCAGNSPETGEFPAQMASNAENVSIWWRHYDGVVLRTLSIPEPLPTGKYQTLGCNYHFARLYNLDNRYFFLIALLCCYITMTS